MLYKKIYDMKFIMDFKQERSLSSIKKGFEIKGTS